MKNRNSAIAGLQYDILESTIGLLLCHKFIYKVRRIYENANSSSGPQPWHLFRSTTHRAPRRWLVENVIRRCIFLMMRFLHWKPYCSINDLCKSSFPIKLYFFEKITSFCQCLRNSNQNCLLLRESLYKRHFHSKDYQ